MIAYNEPCGCTTGHACQWHLCSVPWMNQQIPRLWFVDREAVMRKMREQI